MQPIISIPQHWAYPRFALEQRTNQSNPHLHQLVKQAQTLISKIATHPDYKQLLDLGYQPDLNIADAQTALTYLQWELDRNREPSN
jgi:hypothetical protein